MTRPTVVVAAGVVARDGRVLLSQRKKGTHLAGAWEFPGGKVEPDEDPRDALRRELDEELGIWAHVGDVVEVTFHRYAEKSVLLLFYEVALLPDSPEPRPLDVAAVRWASKAELDALAFPEADVAVLAKVKPRL
ncbi:MAG TPA: (deoxy)nucleoside triphosphate pyrophosphohydrolase [Minicystis sp.]|nr:(deoxy)nucleoside triphosphate pyrophosphohydrolase [Minicystis sp.]